MSFNELPTTNNENIIRSVTPVDPSICQVQLSHLSFESVYNWAQQMLHLQQKFLHEEILWGQFITERIVHVLFAYDEAKHITGGKSIILGKYMGLDNEMLFHLICSIVLPKSEEDWRANFSKMVVFSKTPPNIDIVDTTH